MGFISNLYVISGVRYREFPHRPNRARKTIINNVVVVIYAFYRNPSLILDNNYEIIFFFRLL